jgi:SAM-dependent methyltransferase
VTGEASDPVRADPELNTHIAHPARMYDYYLGGKDNYAADREAADQVLEVLPVGRDMAIANRAFLRRVVRYLAGAGIRQFLDLGTGLPTQGNVHEIAAETAPGARVVYVDNDPIVLAHARALLTGEGTTTVIQADLRDPESILASPAVQGFLDFTQPVAILLVAVLHFIRDSEDPAAIAARLRAALPGGGYLAISHGTQDFSPDLAARAVRFYEQATAPFVLRSKAEIAGFFGDLELVEPGLVQLPTWRPEGEVPAADLETIWLYGGVARKS